MLEQLLLLGWDAPLLLCATLRPGSGQAVAARRVCDAALERFGGDALRLEIGRLDTASGGALLDALIPGLAPNARSALLDHAGANPLFLELLAQRIEQQGALRPEPHGRGLVLRRPLNWLAIPATLRELVVAQLDTLPPAVRRTARAAAVLATAGRTFTRQLLEQIADEPSAIAARLDELKQARVIVPAPSAAESFSFRHPLFQSEAYQLLQSHERRQLHRRAAEALDTGTDADDARSEMLAYHYRQGQVWDRTQVWSLDAGTRARRAYANDRAYAHLRRSLWLARRSGAAPQEAEARVELGDLLSLTGRWEQARAQLTAALHELPPVGNTPEQVELRARCHRHLALVTERLAASDSDYQAAEAHCRAGLELLAARSTDGIEVAQLHAVHAEILERRGAYDDAVDAATAGLAALPNPPAARRERGQLSMRLAAIEGKRGRYSAAIVGLERSLALIDDEDAALRAAMINNRGTFLLLRNNLDDALRAFHESLALQQRTGDLDGQIRTLIHLGGVYQNQYNFEQALLCFAEAQSICERLKLREPLAFVLNNIGIAEFVRGEFDVARTHQLRALEIFRDLKIEAVSIEPIYRLGEIALVRGEIEEALRYGTEALDLAQRAGRLAYVSCALRVIGEALLQQGALAEAAHRLDEAWNLQVGDASSEGVDDPFDKALILAARAQLALALGDCTQAQAHVTAGITLARERGMLYPLGLLEPLQQQIVERCGQPTT